MPSSGPNPFAPASTVPEEMAVFGDAELLRSGFLFRSIVFNEFHNKSDVEQSSVLPFSVRGPNNPVESVGKDRRKPGISLTYSGWWFVQRVYVDRELVWWAISWLKIQSSIAINLASIDRSRKSADASAKFAIDSPSEIKVGEIKIEISFSRGLRIRRFRVWLDREIRYDEIC